MSTIYDNWERLVRAVLKREEIWEICHAPSRSSSPNSTSSDSNSSLTFHFDDHNLIIISPRAEVEESAYQSESEWVEEYEAGVQITLAASIDGNIGVKRASFSLGIFKKHEAVAWWVENRDKVHEKYNIQFLGKSEENTYPKRNENALSKNDSEENLRSKDLEAGGSDDQFVDHRTWIELYEPGICVTLGDFGDGTRYLKRIHFSRRRFEEHEADTWWLTNRDKVYEKYNIEDSLLTQGWRKVYGALKDHIKVGLAHFNSDFKMCGLEGLYLIMCLISGLEKLQLWKAAQPQ